MIQLYEEYKLASNSVGMILIIFNLFVWFALWFIIIIIIITFTNDIINVYFVYVQ